MCALESSSPYRASLATLSIGYIVPAGECALGGASGARLVPLLRSFVCPQSLSLAACVCVCVCLRTGRVSWDGAFFVVRRGASGNATKGKTVTLSAVHLFVASF